MSEHKETRSTCCYCGVGCGVLISSDGEQITGVRGDPEHPANFGRLCSKGSQLHLTSTPLVQAQRRLQQPMLRHQRTDALTATDWDTSIAYVAQRIHRCVQEHGPDSIGFYVSGQLLTEDYFLFNKLARGLIGTNQIDSNSRLCMSSAVAGYKQSLGSDAPPCNYEDLDHADLVLIIGANPAYAHPVLYRRLEAARAKRPQMKLVVVDPRRTDSAQDADLHLAIKPGSDVALLNGLLHICFWEGWIQADWIAAHTSGFDSLRDSVRHCTPEQTAAICGVSADDIYQLARWFAQSPASLSLYCQGLNQSSAGTAKNSALINLHLVTAQIGRAGAGPFSLTGQPNAMGGRETGSMANLLCGHRNLNSAEDRAEVAEFWGIPELPAQAGTTAVDMFEAARSGKIRILWIVCTNPAHSLPAQAQVRAALEAAELVIVQEAFRDTATCAYADVLLPAASWGEKEGTVTNSERRISRQRAFLQPAGEAKPPVIRIRGDATVPYQKVADLIRGRAYTRLVKRRQLIGVNGEFTASIVIARHRSTAAGSSRWRLRLDAGLAPDFTVAVRMNPGNETPLDYYVLPSIDMTKPRLRLAERNGFSLDGYRFDDLDFFYSLAKRASFTEAA